MKDLSAAYIVRVSPMNFEQPVELIARNLHDFLCMLCFHPQLLESDTEQSPLSEEIATALKLKPIEASVHYIEQLQQLRMQEVALDTLDGIGIVHTVDDSKEQISLFHFKNREALTIDEVATFFSQATQLAKLGFLRDAQSKGLLWDNEEIKLFLIEQLQLMELHDEAVRMRYPAY